MRKLIVLALVAVAGCSPAPTVEPSLAPRAAESIDPRVPVPDAVPTGAVDATLAQRLDALVSAARGGVPQFSAREAEATRLAATAGPFSSESWIAAQQALSRLVEQYGVTSSAAADIDALAADRLEGQRWIRPADRNAIASAAAAVGEINEVQSASIDQLTKQLAR